MNPNRPTNRSELSARFSRVDQHFWSELRRVAGDVAGVRKGRYPTVYRQRLDAMERESSGTTAEIHQAFSKELTALIGKRLRRSADHVYVARWLEIELDLFPEDLAAPIRQDVERAEGLAAEIASKYGPVARSAQIGPATFAKHIAAKWSEFSNPTHLTPVQQRSALQQRKKDRAEMQQMLERGYDGIPLLRHLPALRWMNTLYEKYDFTNEWLAKKEIGWVAEMLPQDGTAGRRAVDRLGPYAYAGFKILDSVGSILGGLSLVSGVAAGVCGAAALFTGGLGAAPAAFFGVAAIQMAEGAAAAKAATIPLRSLYSVHQAALHAQGLIAEEEAIEQLKELNTAVVTTAIAVSGRKKSLEDLADARKRFAEVGDMTGKTNPRRMANLGKKLGVFVDKLYDMLANRPSLIFSRLERGAVLAAKEGVGKVLRLAEKVVEWGNRLDSIHDWIGRLKSVSAWVARQGRAVAMGGSKLAKTGVAALTKARQIAGGFIQMEANAFRDSAKDAYGHGVADIYRWVANKLIPDLSERDGAGKLYHDGDLTGPWYPEKGNRAAYHDPEEAVGAGSGIAIYINGIRNNLADHGRAAQELANQLGKPVVGIWNASGKTKGLLGSGRDLAESLGDKLGLAGNPATETLTRLILAHGNASGRNGGLDLYAHSQGSIIVSDAMSKAREKQGRHSLSGVGVTTMGNAAATMPEGAHSYRHFVFDCDLVPAFAGSTSLLNQYFLNSLPGQVLLRAAGLRSTLQDTYVLHSRSDFLRAHAVTPERIGKSGAQGKEDDEDTYVKALPWFEKEMSDIQRARANAEGGAASQLLPARQLAATAYAGSRWLGTALSARIEKGYSRITPLLAASPVGMSGLSGVVLDKGLRFAGRSLSQAGSLVGAGWDALFSSSDVRDPRTRPKIQRKGSGSEPDADPEELRRDLVKRGGNGFQPPTQMRQELGPHLGFDPSGARLHIGPEAAAAARNLGAEAFTIGRDVFFGAGKYDPGSREGMSLIAHELTHVGQQTGGDGMRRFTRDGGDNMEREAQQTAEMYLATVGPTPGLNVLHSHRHILCEGDLSLTAEDERRLNDIYGEAMRIAGHSAKAKTENDFIEALDVEVEIDLNRMSDAQAAQIFANAIVTQINLATQTATQPPSSATPFARIQRYDADEHVMMGGPVEKQESITIRGVKLKYGHLVAMGDFFANPEAILNKADSKKLQAIVDLLDKKLKDPNAVGDEDWQRVVGSDYIALATNNFSHFAPSNPALKAPDPSGSGVDHKMFYRKHHSKALVLAAQQHRDEAMVTNAFADHFLTDAFAAGHLFNKQDVMGGFRAALSKSGVSAFTKAVANAAWSNPAVSGLFSNYETTSWPYWDIDSAGRFKSVLDGIDEKRPDVIENAVVKAIHDQLNSKGVEVQNENATWVMGGDNNLNQESLKQGRLAVQRSREQVLEALAGKTPINPVDEVWKLVPRPTSKGQATIKKQIDSFSDPSNTGTINAIAQIIADSAQAMIVELTTMKDPPLRLISGHQPPAPSASSHPRSSVLSMDPPEPPAKASPKPRAKPPKKASFTSTPAYKAMRTRFEEGMRDENDLTDTAYFFLHPERKGKLIDLAEKKATKEWLNIRDEWVRPLLKKEAAIQKSSRQGAPSDSPEQAAERVGDRVRTHASPLPPQYGGPETPAVRRKPDDKDKKATPKPVGARPSVKPSNAQLVQAATQGAAGKVGWIQRMGAAGEASAMTILRSLGATVKDLNDFTPKSHNFPTLDLISDQGAQSVKVKATDTPFTQSTADAYIRDFRQILTPEGLKSASARIYANRLAIQQAGAWPEGLPTSAAPEAIAKFLSKHSQLAIPQDHVAAVQKALEAKIRANPEGYGLKGVKPGTAEFTQGVRALVGRVKSIGITAGQIDGIIKPMVEAGPESKPKDPVVKKAGPPPSDAPASYQELITKGQPLDPTAEAAIREAARLNNVARVKAVFRYGGAIFLVVGIAHDAVYIVKARDHYKAAVEVAGGWGTAILSAEAFSAWFLPADTAGPGAWLVHGFGVMVAGGIGYYVGSGTTRYIYEVTIEGKPFTVPFK